MSSKNNLASLLTDADLRQWAGPRSYERGVEYYQLGLVESITESGTGVKAKVRGTRDYRVEFWVEHGEITSSCTCPMGDQGEFCKHCVAVGLGLIHRPSPRSSSGAAFANMEDVHAYLTSLDKKALVEMIVAQVVDDDRLRDRLMLKAAKNAKKQPNFAHFRKIVGNVIRVRGFVEYREAPEYARKIDEVIDTLAEILGEGYAAEIIELAEYALIETVKAIGTIDDSDGYMSEILARLQELHFDACEAARPDPKQLAKRLFELEVSSDYDVFSGAAEMYKDILGEEGLAVYRELAEAQWQATPELKPGDNSMSSFGSRYRITHIMETLAAQSGNIDDLIAVMASDLAGPYQYLRIAETCRNAGRCDLALTWAEKGLAAFPAKTDYRLLEFLAEEYHSLGRTQDSLKMIWTVFADGTNLGNYQKLHSYAAKTSQWPEWREKALAFVRVDIEQRKVSQKEARVRWLGIPADHSLLVEIFLWEKDPESAWQEASAGGCHEGLWMSLAAIREKEHPEDAIKVYQSFIEPTVRRTNNASYEEAVQLLKKIWPLMKRTGHQEAFNKYLDHLRTTYKAKRNFIKLLDKTKWR